MRRIRVIDIMVALPRRQEVPCHKSHLNKSPRRSSLEGLPVPKEEMPVANTFSLICEKIQYTFCIGDDRQTYDRRMGTFSKPDKMMDHVKRQLEKKTAGGFECGHPVCNVEGLLLNNVMHFKNHVERVHGIRLRTPKYIS